MGAKDQYAMLWYPIDRTAAPEGVPLGAVWTLLNLKDPTAQCTKLLDAAKYERTIEGQATAQFGPLGVYSLSYPTMPLLMIDFRDGTHLRRRELTQRAVNEITSGVIGVSRITNWYYFAGADLYDFWAARRRNGHEPLAMHGLLFQVPGGSSARSQLGYRSKRQHTAPCPFARGEPTGDLPTKRNAGGARALRSAARLGSGRRWPD